jgi:thioesterase domain-containing protein
VEAFGERSLTLNEPWDEAAGDSLDALRLLFSIEQELGAQLTFEILQPGATPGMLAAAVGKTLEVGSLREGAGAPDASPLIFFFPPMEGDMPHIARFREAFGGRFRFAVIHYPTWREILDAGCGFEAFTNSAIAQVRAKGEAGPFLLFGCSSGGFVAWETARGLVHSGGRIGFLGLIDARRWMEPPEPRENPLVKIDGKLRAILLRPRETLALFLPWLVERLAARSAFTQLSAVLPLAKLLPAKDATGILLSLTHQLRRHALRTLEVAPLEIAATLFRSDLHRQDDRDRPWLGPPDYGWTGVCQKLVIVNIEGSHSAVWEVPFSVFLCRRLMDAVDAALCALPDGAVSAAISCGRRAAL